MAIGQAIGEARDVPADVATSVAENDSDLELAVREHARLVYRIAYSVLRNHHDAEDVTQETFVRVLRSPQNADPHALLGMTIFKKWSG